MRCVYQLYNPVSREWVELGFHDAIDVADFMDAAPGYWHGWKLATTYVPAEAC